MNKDAKICIIGGGPAGLSAAVHLEKKGYTNYTILEKENWVGGKCHSPHYNGKRYEMGAIMGCPTYYAVHELEEFGGASHDGGPKLERGYRRLNGKPYDPFDPKRNPLLIPRLLKTKKQVKKLGSILKTKYKGYEYTGHRGVAEGKYDGFDPVTGEHITGENPNLKDLAMPFDKFCKLNGVELCQDIWIAPFTAFGYGYFDEIPAAYVLKYLDFETAMYFVNKNLWTWTEGTQSIYECVNDKLKHPARLGVNIEKVTRENGKVQVYIDGEMEEYDAIIVTSPLQFLPDYFDATDKEKEYFSKIDYERYDVTANVMKPGTEYPDMSYYIFDNMKPERIGNLMVFYVRWKKNPDQVITTYILRNHKGKELLDYEKGKKLAADGLKTCGMTVDKLVYERDWYYFPHVFEKDYAAGWYDKVEAMQGNLNTYYAGEIMSFGDMEETVQYSKDLVARFF